MNQVRHLLRTAIVGLTLLSGATLVRADVVTDWTQTAIDVMKTVNVAGNPWTRSMAMMHVSMSDSVNAVQNRYARFTPGIPTAADASAEVAAAAAAREILMRQYPGQKARIDAAFAATLESCRMAPRGRPALPWARRSQPPSSSIARTTPPMLPTHTAQ